MLKSLFMLVYLGPGAKPPEDLAVLAFDWYCAAEMGEIVLGRATGRLEIGTGDAAAPTQTKCAFEAEADLHDLAFSYRLAPGLVIPGQVLAVDQEAPSFMQALLDG